MEELKWNPTDVLACLEIDPRIEDDEPRYEYGVSKHGVRLELTVFPLSSEIYITIYCEGVDRALIDVEIIECRGIRYVNDERGEFLEFAPGRDKTSRSLRQTAAPPRRDATFDQAFNRIGIRVATAVNGECRLAT